MFFKYKFIVSVFNDGDSFNRLTYILSKCSNHFFPCLLSNKNGSHKIINAITYAKSSGGGFRGFNDE